MGVEKNQRFRRLARMSRMSRKWTVSEEIRNPIRGKDQLDEDDQGQEQGIEGQALAEHDQKRRRMGRPRLKWTRLLRTVTTGRISAGKRIF